jgi:hypothetical protein
VPNLRSMISMGCKHDSLHNNRYHTLPQGYTYPEDAEHPAITSMPQTHSTRVRSQQQGCERTGRGRGEDGSVDVKTCDLLHNSVKFFQNHPIMPYLSIIPSVNGENASQIPFCAFERLI